MKNLKSQILNSSLFSYFALLASGVIFGWNFKSRFPLIIWDEPLYANGSFVGASGWSPFYKLIYAVLNSVTGDRVSSFYALAYAQTFIIYPGLSFLIARRLGLGNLAAFLFGIFILISPWNFPMEPKVFIFGHILTLAAFALRLRDSKNEKFASYILVAASIFVRVENILFLIGFFGLDAWKIYRSRKKKRRWYLPLRNYLLVIAASLGGIYYYTGKNDLVSPSRVFHAYADHSYFLYRLDPMVRDHKDLNLEQWRNAVFGDSNSVLKSIAERPAFFFFRKVPQVFLLFRPLVDSLDFYYLRETFVHCGLLVGFLFLIICALLPRKFDRGPFRWPGPEVRDELIIFSTAVFLKVASSAIIMQPLLKYSLELSFMVLLGLMLAANAFALKEKIWKYRERVFLVMVLAMFGINKEPIEILNHSLFNREAISEIKKLGLKPETKLLAGYAGLGRWIDHEVRSISPHEICKVNRPSRLADCLRSEKIEAVLYDSDLKFWTKNSPYLKDFARFPVEFRTFGFEEAWHSEMGDVKLFSRVR
jgi:hypothetical protein